MRTGLKQDFCVLCHFNAPDACATAQVENLAGLSRVEGMLVQSTEWRIGPGNLEELVKHIQSFQFGLVEQQYVSGSFF